QQGSKAVKKEPNCGGSETRAGLPLADLTRSALSIPWTVSDATARQLANTMAATVRVTGSPAGEAAEVTAQAIERFGTLLGEVFRIGNSAQQGILNVLLGPAATSVDLGAAAVPGATLPIFNLGAVQEAGEAVTIGYTRGTGTFSNDKRFITLNNAI